MSRAESWAYEREIHQKAEACDFRAFISRLCWTIGVLGFDSRRGLGIFSSPPCPERLWSPPSLLSNGYRVLFPWG